LKYSGKPHDSLRVVGLFFVRVFFTCLYERTLTLMPTANENDTKKGSNTNANLKSVSSFQNP
jgi:hypothetical protein